MAIIRACVNFKTLSREVNLVVVLPVDSPMCREAAPEKFKTLYLLHGIHGSCESWISSSRVASYVRNTNMAIVMPSGENTFYVDNPNRRDFFGEYIGRELVEMTRRMFPLSERREDTFIGGLSMGGYGALINGLKYSDTFGSIAALSSAIHLGKIRDLRDDTEQLESNRGYFESIFGDLTKLEGSQYDCKRLISDLIAQGKPVPDIYIACGTEDPLLEASADLHNFLNSKGVTNTFESWAGAHEWKFWDEAIEKVVARLADKL